MYKECAFIMYSALALRIQNKKEYKFTEIKVDKIRCSGYGACVDKRILRIKVRLHCATKNESARIQNRIIIHFETCKRMQ